MNITIRNISISFFLCLLISGYAVELYSQNEGNVWCFGNGTGLDFNSGSPVSIRSEINSREGCASISDENGNLLFYTDGNTVWNRAHQVMPNGLDLAGSSSTTQSAVIVPHPGKGLTFYLFTNDAIEAEGNGFSYSIVDMTLDDGMGDVDPSEKNVHILDNTTEKLTSVRHKNGIDFWLITHKWESDEFYSFRLTMAGLDTNPVISKTGMVNEGKSANTQGYMKVSTDGSKIASAVLGAHTVELFDFDNADGSVSNPVSIIIPEFEQVYGVEFSSKATKLYVSKWLGQSGIYQFDLSSWNESDIAGSAKLISSGENNFLFGALQIGPDGKIYAACHKQRFLSVVNKPGEDSSECLFVENGVTLNGESYFGLPNCVQSFFQSIYIGSNSPLCDGDTLYLTCNKIHYAKYNWTGPNGFTSNEQNPVLYDVGQEMNGVYRVVVTDTVGRNFVASVRVDIIDIKIGFGGSDRFDLGSVCLGASAQENFYIYNQSKSWVDIDSLYLKHGDENFILNMPSDYNGMAQDKDSILLEFFFEPENAGDFSDSLIVVVANPCYDRFAIEITGSAGETRTSILIEDTLADIGDIDFCIPVNAVLTCRDDISFDLDYEMVLNINSSVFLVERVEGATIIRNEINDGVQELEISGSVADLDYHNQEIAHLCGSVLLGDETFTPIEISSFLWDDPLIEFDTTSGLLLINNICVQEINSITNTATISLRVIPNPADESTELIFNGLSGKHIAVALYSVEGVLVRKWLKNITGSSFSNRSAIKLDISSYQSGLYFIIVTNDNNRVSRPLLIGR